MKRLITLAFLIIGINSFSQVSISQLPLYTGTPSGGFVPIVVSGVTKKIDAGRFGTSIDTTKIPYLAKGNKFTGNDTFPTIAVLNNSYGAGIKTSGDTTIIGDIQNANNGTTLSVNDDAGAVIVNGALKFTGGQTVTSISTDTSLASNSNSVLSTQAAVKAYVANHTKSSVVTYSDSTYLLTSTPSTTTTKYSFVFPSANGQALITNPTPSIGEVDYIYNNTGTYGNNYYFYIARSGSQYLYETYYGSGSPTAVTAVLMDSGQYARLEYVSIGHWNVTIYNLNFLPQDAQFLATSITPADSSSNTLYPSVNAVKRYVQANSGGVKDTILTIVDTFSVGFTHGTSLGFPTISVGTSGGYLTLSPSSTQWYSTIDSRSIIKILIETNIDSLDMASNFFNDHIRAGLSIAYMDNSGAHSSANQIAFEQDVSSAIFNGYLQYKSPTGGVLNSPALIGDATTFSSIIIGSNFALPMNFGVVAGVKYYYLPFIYIPSTAATKNYEFKFTIYYK